MNAWLYTWNPKQWTWSDQAEIIRGVAEGEHHNIFWSCGNTKKIAVGDIFFLMKLGEKPKGIIGGGYICSTPQPRKHWDTTKAEKGMSALRTDVQFKVLTETPIISFELLRERYPIYPWSPQRSGCSVPADIASELFAELQQSSRG